MLSRLQQMEEYKSWDGKGRNKPVWTIPNQPVGVWFLLRVPRQRRFELESRPVTQPHEPGMTLNIDWLPQETDFLEVATRTRPISLTGLPMFLFPLFFSGCFEALQEQLTKLLAVDSSFGRELFVQTSGGTVAHSIMLLAKFKEIFLLAVL